MPQNLAAGMGCAADVHILRNQSQAAGLQGQGCFLRSFVFLSCFAAVGIFKGGHILPINPAFRDTNPDFSVDLLHALDLHRFPGGKLTQNLTAGMGRTAEVDLLRNQSHTARLRRRDGLVLRSVLLLIPLILGQGVNQHPVASRGINGVAVADPGVLRQGLAFPLNAVFIFQGVAVGVFPPVVVEPGHLLRAAPHNPGGIVLCQNQGKAFRLIPPLGFKNFLHIPVVHVQLCQHHQSGSAEDAAQQCRGTQGNGDGF